MTSTSTWRRSGHPLVLGEKQRIVTDVCELLVDCEQDILSNFMLMKVAIHSSKLSIARKYGEQKSQKEN